MKNNELIAKLQELPPDAEIALVTRQGSYFAVREVYADKMEDGRSFVCLFAREEIDT